MKFFPVLLTFTLLSTLFNSSISTAQDQKTFTFSPESEIMVDGTSNRNDWTVTVPQFEGSATLLENSGDTPEVLEARLLVKAHEMTGGRGNIMDRLMYDALKTTQHPDIIYNLTEMISAPDGEDPQAFHVRLTGDLTIAEATRTIEVDLKGTKLEDGSYRFQGSHSLLMRDYGIDPPTAMFGSLVTGNEVVIRMDILAEES